MLTNNGVVALHGQHVVLDSTRADQVELAVAGGGGEVGDVAQGGAGDRPGVAVGVVVLHLHVVQGGTWGQHLRVRAAGGAAPSPDGSAARKSSVSFCAIVVMVPHLEVR